ncbi:hypothetical protein [Arthrobacter sp. EpRS71]|uniref:hypothetical protein n=1 Tax=Arthrobacter sp. EpRS71 TaxID=1743141 RepID=UPI0007470CB7|nr:hypothetical protein [Arthrobacter sp. EpRS71]KUM38983.1 hypothetical protein AR689_07465 [Arthrobacter sp. EpRS71]
MKERLSKQIEEKFQHLTDDELIDRINKAPDFDYDDEAVELNRRLALGGLAWRWSQDYGHETVEVFTQEAGDES